jgi:hypothetical protein
VSDGETIAFTETTRPIDISPLPCYAAAMLVFLNDSTTGRPRAQFSEKNSRETLEIQRNAAD